MTHLLSLQSAFFIFNESRSNHGQFFFLLNIFIELLTQLFDNKLRKYKAFTQLFDNKLQEYNAFYL